MMNDKTIRGIFRAQGVIVILMVVAYVVNFLKFIENDFEAPYKSEIINGIGVFMPPSAIITVWF
jgi:hypothetical protein